MILRRAADVEIAGKRHNQGRIVVSNPGGDANKNANVLINIA